MITPNQWADFRKAMKVAHDSFNQQIIIWQKALIIDNPFGEDSGRKYQDIQLKGLIQYNWFRTWPANTETKTGTVDKEQKERKVGEQPIFRYHGNFADNLRMFVKGYQVSFGIPPGIFNQDTQMDVATYAHIVEFGSLLYDVAITPKPLFGPAFTKVGGNKALKFHIINEITNNLKLGQSFYIR